MDESQKLLVSIRRAQWVQAIVIGLAAISVCLIVVVFGFRIESLMVRTTVETGLKQAEILHKSAPVPPAPSITQTASPTIINNNGRSGWAEDVPHTVNDAAEFLGRTPDTVRSYIPRWIENGESIEKTQGGMWVFPPGFTPYVPE